MSKVEKVFQVADQKNVGMVVAYPIELTGQYYLAAIPNPDTSEFKPEQWITLDAAKAAFVSGALVVCFIDGSDKEYDRVATMKVDATDGTYFEYNGEELLIVIEGLPLG